MGDRERELGGPRPGKAPGARVIQRDPNETVEQFCGRMECPGCGHVGLSMPVDRLQTRSRCGCCGADVTLRAAQSGVLILEVAS